MRMPRIMFPIVAVLVLHGSVRAETADGDNGRFSMAVVADGVIRLDTRTGAVSRCNGVAQEWVCRALPDERNALDAEIGRLAAENDALKTQLAQRDADAAVARKVPDALPKDTPQETTPKADALPRADDSSRKLEIPLPSARDVDRVVDALEQAWRKLVAIAARVQGDQQGKI